MPGQWRSTAAQTFVGGRITQIDGFWKAHQTSYAIMKMIEDWDLWQVVWGVRGKTMQKNWKKYTTGGSLSSRMMTKATSMLSSGKEQMLGKEIFDSLEQAITQPVHRLLSNSSLTINFKADGWFGGQAGFDSYISMWDRLKDDTALDQFAATKSGKQNPANWRAKADRHALYGQFDRSQVKSSGMKLPHVKEVKMFEQYQFSTSKPAATDSQLFSALNYGKRRNGASTEYGKSYFELEDQFKQNAIYFAMDTFTPVFNKKNKADRGMLYQVSYNSFGGAILLAIMEQYNDNKSDTLKKQSIELVTNLLEAANGRILPNTKENHLLLEAHIFEQVKMDSTCIKKVIVAKSELATSPNSRTNLSKFSKDRGIPSAVVDD
jgi:hypothetical protein